MDWSDGYPVHDGHRFLYHRTTGPVHAAHVLRQSGFVVPPLQTCCELGFGQGVSLAVHAAMGGEWWGADVMPGQVAEARDLAGDGVHLSDEGFAEFCARDDLPEFDFVCIYGVWSWISVESRRCVLDFLRRKLRPGGVLHVSYNTAAGWASVLPLRDLLVRHLATLGVPALGPVAAVDAALPELQALLRASAYAAQNPLAPQIMDRMVEAGGRLIMHEYLGQHWTLFHHADVAAEMATAKLDYAAPASRLPMLPSLYLTPAQAEILAGIPDLGFRETVQEILTGERYRRDYWIKGARRLPSDAAARDAGKLHYVLASPPETVELRPDLPQGQVTVPKAQFASVLDVLADYTPRSLDEILAAHHGLSAPAAYQALMLLWDSGAVHPAQTAPGHSVAGCRRFNERVLGRAARDGHVVHLADPVTGGALPFSRPHQLLLLAERAGHAGFAAQAAFVRDATGVELDPAAHNAFFRLHQPILRAHDMV